MLAMRICLGLLGFLHGLGISWLLVLTGSEPITVLTLCLLLVGDVISIALAIARAKRTGVLLAGAAANVIAVITFCVIPFLQSDEENVEGFAMLIASGIVVPLLGPLLVNAFVLFGLDFVQRHTRTTD